MAASWLSVTPAALPVSVMAAVKRLPSSAPCWYATARAAAPAAAAVKGVINAAT
ncbi:Uncharacterised protein [Bordetella pertussis]|nr:Uncharacterised protein [Bordetella pertussis]